MLQCPPRQRLSSNAHCDGDLLPSAGHESPRRDADFRVLIGSVTVWIACGLPLLHTERSGLPLRRRNVLIEAEDIRGIVLRLDRCETLEPRVTISGVHILSLRHVIHVRAAG